MSTGGEYQNNLPRNVTTTPEADPGSLDKGKGEFENC